MRAYNIIIGLTKLEEIKAVSKELFSLLIRELYR